MKTIIAALIPIMACFSFNGFAHPQSNYWNKQTIEQPTNYVFSYGVMVNSESRDTSTQTNKAIFQPVPARISADFGYVRGWNYRSSYGKTALGLILAKKGESSSVNGIIYPAKDLDKLKSDYGFTLIEVPAKYIESAGWQQLPKNAKFWTYIVDNKYLQPADKNHPITQVYLDIALQGFLDYGPEYAKEFVSTTQNWSKYWLNDRVMARNPWYFNGKSTDYNMIDTILEEHFEKNQENYFLYRKFSEEY